MTLKELFDKVPVSLHGNIKVVSQAGVVVYDAGTTIYEAYVADDGTLIPRTKATKDALAAL